MCGIILDLEVIFMLNVFEKKLNKECISNA